MPFETAPVRGVKEHYGRRNTNGKFGGDFGTKDGVRQATYTYSVLDLPSASGDELTLDIPAHAKVLRVYTEVLEAIVGLTSPTVRVVIGSKDTAAQALSAATRGGFVINTVLGSVGATKAEAVVTLGGTGTATAGKLRTIVEYIPEGV
jgi:uncharacterized membrane protein YeaQ/YmgE (transglycosylase-associated protein family)